MPWSRIEGWKDWRCRSSAEGFISYRLSRRNGWRWADWSTNLWIDQLRLTLIIRIWSHITLAHKLTHILIPAMEQIEFVKQKLTIPDFVPLYLSSNLPPFGSFELILLFSAFTLLTSFMSGTLFLIYLVIGFLMPLYFLKGRSLEKYWPWLAMMLLARTVVKMLPVLDVLLYLSRHFC